MASGEAWTNVLRSESPSAGCCDSRAAERGMRRRGRTDGRGGDAPERASQGRSRALVVYRMCSGNLPAESGARHLIRFRPGSRPFRSRPAIERLVRPGSETPLRTVGMSGQLESQHFFRTGDRVRALDARTGYVDDASTLYAVIVWEGGTREEIDQFDPRVMVIERVEQ